MSLPQYIDSLHQTTLDLLRYRDINQLMPQIIERAVKLIGGDRGFVYLVDPDTQVMRQSAAYGFKERFYDDIVVTKGVGITGIVWQTRQTQIVYNYHQWAHRISNLHEPVRHIAAVPLILDDEVVGVISVLKDAPDAVYTEADMKILASFADLSAVAIENSRLYSELQQSEHFKQKITNLMPDIVYVYDLIEQRNIYANLALERVLGTTQAQIYQQSFEGLSTYVHPDDLPKIVEHLKKIQRGEATDVVFEMRLKDKHGVWRWFQNHITLFHWDEAGNLTQILGVLQDVHDRKQAEESLRQTESRFRTLIEHAPEAIFVYDADTGFIVHANQNAIQQFGYSLEQLKQMTPMDLVRLPEDDNRDLT
ncbi:MAG: PAS domain S-box protein, partial [Chloroflexi bacterium]